MRRLLTGELRQGALAGLMADAVAKAAGVPAEVARRALMLSGDLTADGGDRHHRAARPGCARSGLSSSARSSRCSPPPPASVAEAVAGFERASVEYKLDGIRVQIHRRDDEVRIYTRNLNEITATLPGIVEAVRAPAAVAGRARRRGAVDGRGRPGGVPGHRLADRRGRAAGGDRDVPVRPAAPRRRGPARRAARGARRAAAPIAPELKIPGVLTSDPPEGERVLDGGAGRRPRGRRRQGRRLAVRGRPARGAWRKVKPVRTYDLVVLGAEWGHGRRQGWLSNLHLGARDPATRRVRHGGQDASRA